VTKFREQIVEVEFAEGTHTVLDAKLARLVRAPDAPPRPSKPKPPPRPLPTIAVARVTVDGDFVDALRERFAVTRRTGGHVVKVGKRKVIDLARDTDDGYAATALYAPLNEGPRGTAQPRVVPKVASRFFCRVTPEPARSSRSPPV
jgi:hypothetical protein